MKFWLFNVEPSEHCADLARSSAEEGATHISPANRVVRGGIDEQPEAIREAVERLRPERPARGDAAHEAAAL